MFRHMNLFSCACKVECCVLVTPRENVAASGGGMCVVRRSGSEQADLQAWWCVSDRSSSAPARAETFGRCKMCASRCQKPVNRPTSVPPLSLSICAPPSPFSPSACFSFRLLLCVFLYFLYIIFLTVQGLRSEPAIFFV